MSRPLPDPVLFLDHSLGTQVVASALKAAGVRVEVLADHFSIDVQDEKWLPEVGRRGWVIVTKDQRIQRRRVEIEALIRSKAAAFVLCTADMSGAEMAAVLARALPRMRKLLRDHQPPFVARVTSDGRVQLVTEAPRRGGMRR